MAMNFFSLFLLALKLQFSSVQSLSRVRLLATPWIAARQTSLSITNSQSSLRLTSIESVMPSHPLSSPFPLTPNPSQHQSLFQWVNSAWSGQSTGVSALASFLPKKSQGWSPSEWTGWIIQIKNYNILLPGLSCNVHVIMYVKTIAQRRGLRELCCGKVPYFLKIFKREIKMQYYRNSQLAQGRQERINRRTNETNGKQKKWQN